jgi:acrylyl-CoA reductase (NADPH)
MAYNSTVAACGMAGGSEWVASVFPFILRGVKLIGVESVETPFPVRQEAWERLSREFPQHLFDRVTQKISLSQVPGMSYEILKGQVRGRVIVDVNS